MWVFFLVVGEAFQYNSYLVQFFIIECQMNNDFDTFRNNRSHTCLFEEFNIFLHRINPPRRRAASCAPLDTPRYSSTPVFPYRMHLLQY